MNAKLKSPSPHWERGGGGLKKSKKRATVPAVCLSPVAAEKQPCKQ